MAPLNLKNASDENILTYLQPTENCEDFITETFNIVDYTLFYIRISCNKTSVGLTLHQHTFGIANATTCVTES